MNVDGRNAKPVNLIQHRTVVNIQTLADDIPALKIIMKKRYRPTRSLTDSTTARKNFASQIVEMKPKNIRSAKNCCLYNYQRGLSLPPKRS